MPQIFLDIPPLLLAAACLIGFAGGVVKGAVGFAMPLIIVATVSLFIDPKIVVAGLILPILASNISQMLRLGPRAAWRAVKEFRLFIAAMMVCIFASAQVMRGIPAETILLFLGVAVTALSAIQLSGWYPRIPAQWRAGAALLMGGISGVMGGFAGTWGPPTVLYLLALDTPKAKQVMVQGVLFAIGGLMLLFGHLKSGVLSSYSLPFSLLLLGPVLLGMAAGYRLQDRIPQATFRKATLIVLLLAGANLIRRGLLAV